MRFHCQDIPQHTHVNFSKDGRMSRGGWPESQFEVLQHFAHAHTQVECNGVVFPTCKLLHALKCAEGT